MVDLTKVSSSELLSALGKRRRAKQTAPPRKPVMRPCPHCGQSFAARAMRKHQPVCRREIAAASVRLRQLMPPAPPQRACAASFLVESIHRFRGPGWKMNP